MEQTQKGKDKGNVNPTTMTEQVESKKGEEKMGQFTNHNVKEIRKHLASGWAISDEDKLVIDAVEHVELKDLINGHTTEVTIGKNKVKVLTLTMMKNLVVLTHPKEKNKAGQQKTKSFHLWQREEWMKVLPEAGPMVRIKKPNQKKGEWRLLDNCTVEDLEWLQYTVQGNRMKDMGFQIPSIGGLNFKTGEIENKPSEPIVVNSIELHHKWHVNQNRIDATSTKEAPEIQYCINKATEARKVGNEEAAKKWEDKAHFFRTA